MFITMEIATEQYRKFFVLFSSVLFFLIYNNLLAKKKKKKIDKDHDGRYALVVVNI